AGLSLLPAAVSLLELFVHQCLVFHGRPSASPKACFRACFPSLSEGARAGDQVRPNRKGEAVVPSTVYLKIGRSQELFSSRELDATGKTSGLPAPELFLDAPKASSRAPVQSVAASLAFFGQSAAGGASTRPTQPRLERPGLQPDRIALLNDDRLGRAHPAA